MSDKRIRLGNHRDDGKKKKRTQIQIFGWAEKGNRLLRAYFSCRYMPEVGVKKNNRKTEIPGAKEKGFSGLFSYGW